PITISAPSWERMTSSTAWRSGVPGAIVWIAVSRFGSRRGSSSEGVRVKPSSGCCFVVSFGSFCGIESDLDRLAERLRFRDLQFAMARGAFRDNGPAEAELGGLLQAPLGLGRLPEAAGEADLAERRGAGNDR